MCIMEKIKTEREREREGERERAFFLKIALDCQSIFKHVIKHVISVFFVSIEKMLAFTAPLYRREKLLI